MSFSEYLPRLSDPFIICKTNPFEIFRIEDAIHDSAASNKVANPSSLAGRTSQSTFRILNNTPIHLGYSCESIERTPPSADGISATPIFFTVGFLGPGENSQDHYLIHNHPLTTIIGAWKATEDRKPLTRPEQRTFFIPLQEADDTDHFRDHLVSIDKM